MTKSTKRNNFSPFLYYPAVGMEFSILSLLLSNYDLTSRKILNKEQTNSLQISNNYYYIYIYIYDVLYVHIGFFYFRISYHKIIK